VVGNGLFSWGRSWIALRSLSRVLEFGNAFELLNAINLLAL
jgi:hypothetical protein